jgi:hypothetical protein
MRYSESDLVSVGDGFWDYLHVLALMGPEVCVTSRLEKPSHSLTPGSHHRTAAVLTSVYGLTPTPISQKGLARCERLQEKECLRERKWVWPPSLCRTCARSIPCRQPHAVLPEASHLGILPTQLRAETEACRRHSAAVQMPVPA